MDPKFKNIFEQLTPEQRKIYDSLGSSKEQNEYLYNIAQSVVDAPPEIKVPNEGDPYSIRDISKEQPTNYTFPSGKRVDIKIGPFYIACSGVARGEIDAMILGIKEESMTGPRQVQKPYPIQQGKKHYMNYGEKTFYYHNYIQNGSKYDNQVLIPLEAESGNPLYDNLINVVLPVLRNQLMERPYEPELTLINAGNQSGFGPMQQVDYLSASKDYQISDLQIPIKRPESLFGVWMSEIFAAAILFLLGVIGYKLNENPNKDVEEYFKQRKREDKIKETKRVAKMKLANAQSKQELGKEEEIRAQKEVQLTEDMERVNNERTRKVLKAKKAETSKEMLSEIEDKRNMSKALGETGPIDLGTLKIGTNTVKALGGIGEQAIKSTGQVAQTGIETTGKVLETTVGGVSSMGRQLITSGGQILKQPGEALVEGVKEGIKGGVELGKEGIKESGYTERKRIREGERTKREEIDARPKKGKDVVSKPSNIPSQKPPSTGVPKEELIKEEGEQLRENVEITEGLSPEKIIPIKETPIEEPPIETPIEGPIMTEEGKKLSEERSKEIERSKGFGEPEGKELDPSSIGYKPEAQTSKTKFESPIPKELEKEPLEEPLRKPLMVSPQTIYSSLKDRKKLLESKLIKMGNRYNQNLPINHKEYNEGLAELQELQENIEGYEAKEPMTTFIQKPEEFEKTKTLEKTIRDPEERLLTVRIREKYEKDDLEDRIKKKHLDIHDAQTERAKLFEEQQIKRKDLNLIEEPEIIERGIGRLRSGLQTEISEVGKVVKHIGKTPTTLVKSTGQVITPSETRIGMEEQPSEESRIGEFAQPVKIKTESGGQKVVYIEPSLSPKEGLKEDIIRTPSSMKNPENFDKVFNKFMIKDRPSKKVIMDMAGVVENLQNREPYLDKFKEKYGDLVAQEREIELNKEVENIYNKNKKDIEKEDLLLKKQIGDKIDKLEAKSKKKTKIDKLVNLELEKTGSGLSVYTINLRNGYNTDINNANKGWIKNNTKILEKFANLKTRFSGMENESERNKKISDLTNKKDEDIYNNKLRLTELKTRLTKEYNNNIEEFSKKRKSVKQDIEKYGSIEKKEEQETIEINPEQGSYMVRNPKDPFPKAFEGPGIKSGGLKSFYLKGPELSFKSGVKPSDFKLIEGKIYEEFPGLEEPID